MFYMLVVRFLSLDKQVEPRKTGESRFYLNV